MFLFRFCWFLLCWILDSSLDLLLLFFVFYFFFVRIWTVNIVMTHSYKIGSSRFYSKFWIRKENWNFIMSSRRPPSCHPQGESSRRHFPPPSPPLNSQQFNYTFPYTPPVQSHYTILYIPLAVPHYIIPYTPLAEPHYTFLYIPPAQSHYTFRHAPLFLVNPDSYIGMIMMLI